MFRRAASAAFTLAFVLVAACGHQVTPSPSAFNNDLSGHMQVKFQVNAPLDFTNVTYVIAVDMCGIGVPYPQAFLTSYNSYTFAFLVGGGFGSTALPVLEQYYINGAGGNFIKVPVNNLNPSTTQFIPAYAGNSNEFEFTFIRSDLNNPLGIPLPCPNSTIPTATPTASPTATSSPTVAAGSSPTAVPFAAGTATPTASPTPAPTPTAVATAFPYLTTWTFNLMTFAAGGGPPLDSLGEGGPTDQTYSGLVVDTTTTTEQNYNPQPLATPQNPAADITYGEIDNYP